MARTLAELEQGARARIQGTRAGGGAVRQRLLDMGVTRGAELLVERVAPLGDPIEILIKGYHLAIRRDEASFIEVEACGDER
jgi:ferrous iron transport protein A